MNPLLTIYTPTFNRSKLLERVFDSVRRQSCKNFKWVIIDDGSSDDTASKCKRWIAEEKNIAIEYYYKENGGVHTARDYMYQICDTELVMSVDSDDWLLDDGVEKICLMWEKFGEKNRAGIFAPNLVVGESVVTNALPKISKASYQELSFKYGYKKDKTTIIRTDIIKSISKYPIYPGEKLVGESYKWIQLPNDIPFLIMDTPVKGIEYLEAGYSRNSSQNRKRNLNGFHALYGKYIAYARYLKPRIKGQVGYIITGLMLGNKHIVRESPKPFVTAMFFPLVWVCYVLKIIK